MLELLSHSPKPLKGAGQLILYLDFDGVLHDDNCHWHPKRGAYLVAPAGALFEHVGLLCELLEPYPMIQIVLSTSWVRKYGCHGASKRLPATLRRRVIGATFHSRMNSSEFIDTQRGMQVCGDVVRRNPRDWIALDDDSTGWPQWCLSRYVQTDGKEGISHPVVLAEIKKKLEVMCSNHNDIYDS